MRAPCLRTVSFSTWARARPSLCGGCAVPVRGRTARRRVVIPWRGLVL